MRQRANLKLVTTEAPAPVFGSTTQKRRTKHHKFLTEAQVEALAKAASNHRDRTMIMITFRHGLRVSELVSLKWEQVDLDAATMFIYRNKHGRDATHPIPGSELRDLRRLKREGAGEYLFPSRLGSPMSPRAFAQMLEKTAKGAGLPRPFNPHSLRHACGYYLASAGRSMRDIQHYLGHRDLKSTEIYTEAAPTNFRGFFR
jgi:type 1 fimbriae regulatory protein FimB/type 1 fimbriae regulatory protein FimE